MQKYLKCSYFECFDSVPITVKPDQYLITFRVNKRVNIFPAINGKDWPSENEDWCVVDRGDVITASGKGSNGGYNGIAKVIVDRMRGDKGALVLINDFYKQENTGFWVPLDDIITHDSIFDRI